MHFSTNIKYLRKRIKKSQKEIALSLDLKRSTLNNYENGQTVPNANLLISFSEYYKIAIDTLLRVDLTALSAFQISELERGNDVYIRGSGLRVLATTVNSNNVENIELVTEQAKAGYVTGYADPSYISELPVFNLPFLSSNRKYRTFQISGDSMLPFPDKSWVTGEYLHDWYRIKSGKPYIILTMNDGVIFKIVENLTEAKGILRFISLNPIYEPFEMPVSEIMEVWSFVHFISKEIPAQRTGDEGELRKLISIILNEVKVLRKELSEK